MKILITGAAGFLGRHLAEHLAKHRPDAALFSIGLTAPSDPRIEHSPCDMTQADAVTAIVKKISPAQIYHLVGTARVSAAIGMPKYFQSNFLTTVSLIQALENSKSAVSVFFSSTVHVYGNQKNPADEKTDPQPVSPYAFSKLLAEFALRDLAKRNPKVKVIVGRLYSCIGPGQPEGFVTSDLSLRLARLGTGPGTVLKTGPLSPYRCFLDVRDATASFPVLLESPQLESGEVVNIASSEEVQIKQVLDMLLQQSGKTPRIESEEPKDPTQFSGLKIRLEKLRRVAPDVKFRPLQSTLSDIWQATLRTVEISQG